MERRAASDTPEHVDADVYTDTAPEPGTKLGEYVHPWVLPFSLPFLEIRTYLEHLGSSSAEVLRVLDDGNGSPSAEDIAGAKLGLSGEHWQIIADTWSASVDKREFWGYVPGVDDDWMGVLSGEDDPGGDPGELLRRGGYELDELQALLDLTFIDPSTYDGSGYLAFEWNESCSLADARIVNLDDNVGAFDRLHRFTRLQRATKIPPRALNILIERVGGGALDEDFLRGLAAIISLHEQTKLDYDLLATWWSDGIDAESYPDGPPSLYHRRFLAPGCLLQRGLLFLQLFAPLIHLCIGFFETGQRLTQGLQLALQHLNVGLKEGLLAVPLGLFAGDRLPGLHPFTEAGCGLLDGLSRTVLSGGGHRQQQTKRSRSQGCLREKMHGRQYG